MPLTKPIKARLKKSQSRLPKTRILAKDMIYSKMMLYDTKAKDILQFCLDVLRRSDKAQADKIKQLINKMHQFDQLVIDCAHKLAPYQSPKLESVEVKSKVEHRYVMQVPQQMKSKEDWMRTVGAEKIKEEEINQSLKKVESKIAPSIHDFDTDEDELDERETFNRTVN